MKFLNHSSVGFSSMKMTDTLCAFGIPSKPRWKIIGNAHFVGAFLWRAVLVMILAWPVLGWGQTVIYTNGGTSYTNTKSRTFNAYGPVTVQCSSINFTLSYNFSRPWSGSGNMESNDECPSAGGCPGDPEDPGVGGCANCWDFIWVRLFVNGAEVFNDLIGAGNNQQTGVISTPTPIPTNPGDQVSIEVYTQTWAADESITFNNIRITGNAAPAVLLPLMDPYCQTRGNVSLTPSQNGLAGTWSGPGVTGTNFNTNTAGPGTHTLTFTPNANQCATPNTLQVEVEAAGPAQLDALGPFCQNTGNINLPTNQNGITGNWSGPGVTSNRLNTSTGGPKTLTFTPTAGQCATANTIEVQVDPAGPTPLDDLGPFCQNTGTINLPTVQNGISGNWSGTGVTSNRLNTSTGGPRTLTFTPSAGQCAATNTIQVNVDPPAPAQLDNIGPFCQNTGNVLLPTTQNGVSGNWSGTGVTSNRLNTTTIGIKNLTFTPGAGQCATAAPAMVEVVAPTVPSFTNLGPYCQGQGTVALPTTDNNGIVGGWSGTGVTGGINLNPGIGGTGNRTLRFTPGANQCAVATDIIVNIQPNSTTVVTTPGPFCTSTTAVALNTTQGGQVGNWSGTGVSANRLNISTAGNKSITFTPTNPCFSPVTVSVVVGNSANLNAIANQNICGNSFTLPPITSANTLDGTEAYYTGANGTGTRYAPGTKVTGSQTLFAYYNSGGCSDQKSFTLTFQATPQIDSIRDTTICGTFTLPIIKGPGVTPNAAYYTQTMGGGTRFNPGQVVNTSQTLFAYDNNGTCSDQDTFRVNIVAQPRLDTIPNVQVCSSYTLPNLSGPGLSGNQAYYTAPNGGGTKYLPGQSIVGDLRLYAFDRITTCTSERTFLLDTISPPALDSVRDTTVCGTFILPSIKGKRLSNNVAYYTQTLGAGTRFNPGQSITTTQNLFIYDGTTGCFDQDTFRVNIVAQPRLDTIPNVQICSSYTLPNLSGTGLSGNEAYYTAPNGGGTKYLPGQSVVGDVRLYAFDRRTICTTERTFLLDTLSPPELDPLRDTTVCGSFILPAIKGKRLSNNAAYYTQTLGAGTRFNPGQSIATTQNLFIYDGTAGCFDQDTFRVTLANRPQLDTIVNVQICNAYTLPTIRGTSLSGNEAYYTAPNGGGTKYLAGQSVAGDLRLYAFDQVVGCTAERSFLLDTLSPPQIDSIPDTTACGSMQLPLITGRNLSPNVAYFEGMNGTGTRYNPGQIFSFSANLFIFDQKGSCSAEQIYRIGITPGPRIELVIDQAISCNGSNDGALDLRINNSLPPVNFRWSQANLNGIEDPKNLGPGTYTVTVTDGTACEVIASVTLIEPTRLTLTCAQSKAVSRPGGNDGEASLTIAGGTGPYVLTLYDPITHVRTDLDTGTVFFTNLGPGTYRVALSDSLGCTDSCAFTIVQPVCNLTIGTTFRNPGCVGEASGQISVTTTGGAFPLRIDWDQNTLDGQFTPQNLPAGLYRFVVEDNDGCQIRDSVRLRDPAPLTLGCAQQTAVTRVGGTDGRGTLSLGGGTRPYRISWTGPSSGSFTIRRTGDTTLTGLRAGQYRIEMRDQNNCVDSCVMTITEPVCNLQASVNVVRRILCNGDDNGSLEAGVRNGRAPFSYVWSSGTGVATTDTIKNLSPGLYTLIVTDNIGCKDTAQFDLTEPAPLMVNCQVVSNVTTVGGRDGQAKLFYSGGTGIIALDWGGSQPGSVIARSRDSLFLGSLSVGTYSPNFIDANGCRSTCAFSINEPVCTLQARLQAQDPACQGATNGRIVPLISAGTAPFTFQWSNNSNNDTLQNVGAGTYQVTITDAINCKVVLDTVLQDPPAMVATCQVTQNARTVNGREGRAQLTFSGGTAPYAISVQGPVNSTRTENASGNVDLTGLSSGTYVVLFTDSKGCVEECSFTISEPNCTLMLQSQATHPLCNGAATGQITVAVSGGRAPLQYDWSDNANDGQATARNLRAGTYIVAVTDSIGCVGVDTITLTDPSPLSIACGTPIATTTVGGQNGRITVRFSGGTGPYKLILSGAKRDSFLNVSVDSFMVNNLSKGNYRLSLTDASGCSIQGCDFQIDDPVCNLVLSLTATNNLCAGASQGSIQSTVTGGVGPFVYDWSDNRFDGSAQATGLSSGTYQLIVTDAQLCRDTASVTLTDPAAIETTCMAIVQPSTPGGTEGRARVVIRGGSGQRRIQLSGPSPGQMQQSSVDTFSFSNLAAGTYSVVVTDANGCADTCGFTLSALSCNLQGTAQSNNPDCNGSATGSINVSVTSNFGAVTYAWSNPALTGPNPNALAAGTYRVTLTDAAQCKDTLSITLNNPPQLTLNAVAASQPTPTRPNGGSIGLNYAGGTPGYRVNWSPNGSAQSIGNTGNFTIPNLPAGTYTITLTDSKGCTAQAQVTLSAPPCNLNVDIASARANCESSHLNTTVTGGTGPFQYAWNPNRFSGQANPRNAAPGTYQLTVTDATGCTARDSIVVVADPLALQVDFGVLNPPCPGDFGVFFIRTIAGGQGPFVLSLSGRNPQRFNNPPLSVRDLTPGTFNLQITNASGCSMDTSITINPARNLSLELGQDTTLRRGAKITFKPNVNFNPVQINWSPSEGLTGAEGLNAQAEPAFTTTYTLLLSDSSGCEISDKIQVLVAGQAEAYFPTAFSPNGDDVNDYFTAFANEEDIEALEYLRIFDRWGNLVFEGTNIPLNDLSKGWDGTSKGQLSPIGLYVFSSVVRLKNGSTYQKAGEVNLVR